MTGLESGDAAWPAFWDVLLAMPLPPHVATPIAAPLDDEFDFLAEPAQQPAPLPIADETVPNPARLAQLAVFEARLPYLAQAVVPLQEALRDDRRLDRLDAAGALWLFRVLLLAPAAAVPEHGALLRVIQRSARSPNPTLVALAADVIAHLDARAAQLDLVARLHADPRSLGHAGVDRVLACLKQVADGRCVREMETLLVERGADLSDVHAWQARHIVQVIRRAGRK